MGAMLSDAGGLPQSRWPRLTDWDIGFSILGHERRRA